MTSTPDESLTTMDDLAEEVAASRQSLTNQAVVVLTGVRDALERLDRVSAEIAVVQQQQSESLEGIARLVTQHDRMIKRLEALAGIDADGDEPRLAVELRHVLDEESARFGAAMRERLSEHAAEGERVLGAGLTSVAARLGEALAELREEMAKELDGWISDLPTETRMKLLADRVEELAERIAMMEALLRAVQEEIRSGPEPASAG